MGSSGTSLAERTAGTVARALDSVLPPELAGSDPLLRPSEHADFQSNAALALAKKAARKPRDLADEVVEAIHGSGPGAVQAAVSGPGFVNVTVSDASVWGRVAELRADDRLGVPRSNVGQRVVIDYSSPNVAKEMHVGHLRTTIIGDALVRVLDFLGADVVRQNHLGDWGTQFGMLIQYLREAPDQDWRSVDGIADEMTVVSQLDALYRRSRARFDADAAFADRARERVVALQSGEVETTKMWRELVEESERAFQAIYRRLDVRLTADDSAGESTYNAVLDSVLDEVVRAGLAVESEGALCVFSEQLRGPDGDPVPLILRKRDGGYGYAITDLATIRHRILDLEAARLLYVVDARQSQHFQLIFEVARRMGWLTDRVEAVHVAFGTVLGPDGKPFKTRSGATVRLVDLLDSAVDKARDEIRSRRPEMGADELDALAETVGLGAVKYADLSTSRTKDYAFDVDRMVSFVGNTGVYVQYAHARICSILRRLPPEEVASVDASLPLQREERVLALLLDQFVDVVGETATQLEPHRLCTYVFDLARAFSDFYEACPVLQSEPDTRGNRVALCETTRATLAAGLHLLGLSAPDRL